MDLVKDDQIVPDDFSMVPSAAEVEAENKSNQVPIPQMALPFSEGDIKITEEDKSRFFSCIMEDRPYSEEMPLFNGKIKVVFRTRTVEETEEIIKQMSSPELTTTLQVEMVMSKMHLAYALVKLGDRFFDQGSLKDRAERFKGFSSAKYTAILELCRRFDLKAQKLSKMAYSENF